MTKRVFAVCLTTFLLLSLLCVTAFATEGGWQEDYYTEYPDQSGDAGAVQPEPSQEETAYLITFPDVVAGDWYYDCVMALTNARVIDGFSDGTFKPAKTVTTGQALKMILLAAGYPTPEPVASHWARGYLDMALSLGILESGEITDLDVPISRGMVAKLSALALGVTRQNPENFFIDTDDDHTHALFEAGIITGYTDNSYKPGNTLKRSELAAIVWRIYDFCAPKDDPGGEEAPGAETITLKTTEAGVDFIKSVEGFVEKPYWDYQQYSVGYGSRCGANDYPNGITREEADLLLRTILAGIEEDLDAYLEKHGLTLASNQYDAMVSFTYNTGSGWMRASRLSNYLISGQYTDNEFASAYGIWCHVGSEAEIFPGLITRRMRELKIFLDNDYTGKVGRDFHYIIFQTDIGELEADVGFYRAGTEFSPYFLAEAAGDTFLGWQREDGSILLENETVSQNMTLTALWQSTSPNLAPTTPDPGYDPGFEPGSFGSSFDQGMGGSSGTDDGSSNVEDWTTPEWGDPAGNP